MIHNTLLGSGVTLAYVVTNRVRGSVHYLLGEVEAS